MEKERKKIPADETIELEERTKAIDLNKTCENNKLEEDNVTATVNGADCIASKGSEPQPYTELKGNVGKYNAKDTIKGDGFVTFRRSASYRNRQRHSESDEISRRYKSNNDIDSITATAKSDNDCASFEEAKICRSRRKQNVVPPNSYSDISLQGINATDGTCMANANSLPRNLFHSGQSTGISPYFSSSLCLMSDSPSQKAVASESLPECNVIENLMELTDPSQFDNTDFNRSVEQESDVRAGDPTRQCRRGRMRRMGMTHPCIPFTVSLSQSISGDEERLLLKSQSEGGPINDDKGEFTPGINKRLETASTNGSLEGDEKRNFTNESCHSYNEACMQASAEDGWANNTIGPNGETFSNEDSLDDNEHAHYLTKDRYSFSLTSQKRRKVMGAVSNADNSNIVFHADMEPSPVNSELSQQQSYSSNIQKHNRQISTEDVSGYITSSVSPERTMSLSSNDEYGALSDVKLRLKKSISDSKEALESMDSRFEHLNNDVNNLKLDVEVLSDLLHKLLKKSDETSM